MITFDDKITVTEQGMQYIRPTKGYCLSTDTKPTTGIGNGSVLIEIDTGKSYVFDEEHTTWVASGVASSVSDIKQLTRLIARGSVEESYWGILQAVKDGLGPDYFPIGSQIPCTWDNGTTVYDFPWDVVDHRNVVNAKGHTVPAMILQAHWCLPTIQFDGNEAFKVATGAALEAGKYYFKMGQNWGNNVVKDKIYSFTLAADLPEHGQLVLGTASSTTSGLPDTAPSNWRVLVYDAPTDTTPKTRLELTEEDSAPENATDLGTLSNAEKFDATGVALNNMQRSAYGYNRWSMSGVRQMLNSDAPAGSWYHQQHPYDRPPDQLGTYRGFMAGLPGDFLAVVPQIEVVTALNTISDSEIGTTETTLDRFFLPSLEEEYIVPQLADVEGPYWPYWKERLGLDSPQVQYAPGTNPHHIRYLVSNHSQAQSVRLRSAFRGNSYNTWYVNSTGYAYSYNSATSANALAPACAICSSD